VTASRLDAAVTAGMAVTVEGVSFAYEGGADSVSALDDVSVDLPAGSSTALLGATGAGKTTLLQVVRGLDPPAAGRVLLDGVGPGEARYAALQREVGLVFQRPERQLFAATARDDVAFGPRALGWPEEEVAAAVAAAMEQVGLPPGEYGGRHPYSLSGGEQRRLALAGVLALRPRLLLLDEPFVSLDPASRESLLEVLDRLSSGGVTLLLATHDVDLAWRLCERLVVLREGRVALAGPWDLTPAGQRLLAENRLRPPFLAGLWQRLGRDPAAAPRTLAEAAEALA